MNKLQTILQRAFCTNFMLYYSSHVAHVNITGRNFQSDHLFLQGIYEDAQENIDTYAEFMRTIQCKMPDNLTSVITFSEISDDHTAGSADKLLNIIDEHIATMLEVLEELYTECEAAWEYGLSNYAQDRMIVHRKQYWQLCSILGKKEAK